MSIYVNNREGLLQAQNRADASVAARRKQGDLYVLSESTGEVLALRELSGGQYGPWEVF